MQIGLRCFVGSEVAGSEHVGALIASFEALDPESAFQDLRSLATTFLTNKRRERRAIRDIEAILRTIYDTRGQCCLQRPRACSLPFQPPSTTTWRRCTHCTAS